MLATLPHGIGHGVKAAALQEVSTGPLDAQATVHIHPSTVRAYGMAELRTHSHGDVVLLEPELRLLGGDGTDRLRVAFDIPEAVRVPICSLISSLEELLQGALQGVAAHGQLTCVTKRGVRKQYQNC